MGAISSSASLQILKEFLADSNRSVRETCEIAIAKIEWDNSEEGRKHQQTLESVQDSPYISPYFIPSFLSLLPIDSRLYTSIDPAPATSGLLSGPPKPESVTSEQITTLQESLTNTDLPLFERYRAMFALRNIGTPLAVDALASGFSDESALFKYVPPAS